MNSNLYIIVRREYLERVKTKSFIITTILMPLLMLALMFVPALVMIMAEPESKTIAVVDNSGIISNSLDGTKDLTFVLVNNADTESLKKNSDYDGILIIGSDLVDNPSNVQLYTHSASSMETEGFITNQLSQAVRNVRLQKYDIDNLSQILADAKVNVKMSTYRLDSEEEKETSSTASYLIGLVMSMMLYMFLLIYGQMVMTSIIEEKNNRVLEVVVSSVKPKALMLGKILGICAVAITQILIWGVIISACSVWLMPLLTKSVPSDEMDLMVAVGQLGDLGYVLGMFGCLTLFLIGGFMLYSSMYAAIGSAVDNIQDASQLTSIVMVPIILAIIFSMAVAQDPNSSMAVWLSIIPFTSPMVMMARLPFGIPAWEIWVSLAVLYASFFVMVWLAAKIYRVGIFMYGKKPSVKDLVRWAQYK
ncbi:MAG: ABC transporter permease [Bacteroidales bacterium]|nr:ABC transporter permease [Bacteroidales bacterium]